MSPIRAAVPTAEEVSALLAGVWRTVDTETDAVAAELAGDESDAVLLDLVATPFASVSDVNERLARTESYLRERGDRRAVFLTVYSRMTATVQTAIDDGAFLDSEWAASYLVAFAERYRRALVAFERRAFESLPRPWLIAALPPRPGARRWSHRTPCSASTRTSPTISRTRSATWASIPIGMANSPTTTA